MPNLTTAQQTTLRNFVLASPTLSVIPHTADGAFDVATALNAIAVPDYFVWRTFVTEHEITRETSFEGTTWSWPAFIARSEPERSGWARMFNGTFSVNPALANVRQGFQDIFSGAQNNAPAQRAHLLAICKRKATVAESLLATGNGAIATPSTMTVEGNIVYTDVINFMGW